MNSKLTLAVLGLGKMGSRIAEKLLRDGHSVVVWNRTDSITTEFQLVIKEKNLDGGLDIAMSIEEVAKKLEAPRIFWVMLPAGEATQNVLNEVANVAQSGDIIIDGGNAFYQDTDRRSEEFSAKGVAFLGIGVSGGIIAEKQGYPLMVGGDQAAYETVKPILQTLSQPYGGYDYFGPGGAGHFVKMVHNAIEYGYMQAIGEGFGVLEKSTYEFDLQKVAQMYQKGTLISGFMIDRAADALKKDPKLEHIEGVIGRASGETVWTLQEAKKDKLPMPVTQMSYDFRLKSETDPHIQQSIAAKMVSALRHEFGGHEVKKKD